MKPWEERWAHDGSADLRLVESGELTTSLASFDEDHARPGGGLLAHDRCELAAAAPDMARVLLAIEWGGHCMSYGHHCPSCGAYPCDGEKGHKPDCALDAALRKAGVR
jgi:hypothetical protein